MEGKAAALGEFLLKPAFHASRYSNRLANTPLTISGCAASQAGRTSWAGPGAPGRLYQAMALARLPART